MRLNFIFKADVTAQGIISQQHILEAVFQTIPNGVQVLEPIFGNQSEIVDFRYLFVSKHISASPGPGDYKSFLNENPLAAESGLFEKLCSLYKQGFPVEETIQFKRDNEAHWLKFHAIKNDNVIVISKEDVTEIEEIRQKFNLLNQSIVAKNRELETLNTELKTFTSLIANDYFDTLRNLYTSMEFIVSNDAAKLSDAGKANVRRAQAAIQKMKLLTDDIISYAKVDNQDSDLTDVNLNEGIAIALHHLQAKIDESGAIVVYDELPTIKGYPHLLRVLFTNLLDNAIKFRKEDGVHEVKITSSTTAGINIDHVAARKDTDYVVLTISDNGIGFSKEEVDRIFEMFYRANVKNKNRGSGIGLAISKKILEIHGGFMKADCNPDCTTFSCYFPVD
ncbi:MAG: hypothetical protein H7Y31_14115 [Chitinophagaceae bacterium]|nr:hypothetical protein [Chitinophagaceae bacterium]